jgi:hypothetical protein
LAVAVQFPYLDALISQIYKTSVEDVRGVRLVHGLMHRLRLLDS